MPTNPVVNWIILVIVSAAITELIFVAFNWRSLWPRVVCWWRGHKWIDERFFFECARCRRRNATFRDP